MEFSNKDIADYYNTTQTHYETWWNLKETHALHYGIWNDQTKNFKEALTNTNKVIADLAKIAQNDRVLDAGCGVGGTAFFLNKNYNAVVTGISLSEKQLSTANASAQKLKINQEVSFQAMDYHNTSFEDESFDIVWACESMCHSHDKELFLKECFRLLKKGGRLVIADYFKTPNQKDPKNYIQQWIKTWSVPDIMEEKNIQELSKKTGFKNIQFNDFTLAVKKSVNKMYKYAVMAAIPSETYNLFHPKVSRFAKTHYKCGIYQYKAYHQNLWQYKVVVVMK